MNAKRSENTQKMDQLMNLIRNQFSEGKTPIEVEEYLIEKGLPKQTAVDLIKMNLKPKPKPDPEQDESIFKSKFRGGREKEMIIFINVQASEGKDQAEIVDDLVNNGLSQGQAISLVVKTLGVDPQE